MEDHNKPRVKVVGLSAEQSELLQTGALKTVQEIERKFLVYAPNVVLDWPEKFIEQNYLAIAEDTSEVRIRNSGCDECTLTVKSGAGRERTETEIPITTQQYLDLFHFKVGTIEKTRYYANGFEIDFYRRPVLPADFYIVEREFKTAAEAEAFTDSVVDTVSEIFYDKVRVVLEVTDDQRFKNQSIATNGFPSEVMESVLKQ